MQLYLKFTAGPLKGKGIPLKRSLTIGRRGTDLEIDDAKLSQIHAFINFKPPNQYILEDNNSRNGLWSKGEKVKKLVLSDGVEFTLGDSTVRCRLVAAAGRGQVSNSFAQWISQSIDRLRNQPLVTQEINPQINLRFTDGIQYGTLWEIFYGPRQVGAESLDLCIYGSNLPPILFTIESINKGAFLRTKHAHILQINGQHLDTKLLEEGDILEFGESKIRVEKVDDQGY